MNQTKNLSLDLKDDVMVANKIPALTLKVEKIHIVGHMEFY